MVCQSWARTSFNIECFCGTCLCHRRILHQHISHFSLSPRLKFLLVSHEERWYRTTRWLIILLLLLVVAVEIITLEARSLFRIIKCAAMMMMMMHACLPYGSYELVNYNVNLFYFFALLRPLIIVRANKSSSIPSSFIRCLTRSFVILLHKLHPSRSDL